LRRAGCHEAPELRLDAARALLGLLLERLEASEPALGFDDPLDAAAPRQRISSSSSSASQS